MFDCLTTAKKIQNNFLNYAINIVMSVMFFCFCLFVFFNCFHSSFFFFNIEGLPFPILWFMQQPWTNKLCSDKTTHAFVNYQSLYFESISFRSTLTISTICATIGYYVKRHNVYSLDYLYSESTRQVWGTPIYRETLSTDVYRNRIEVRAKYLQS